MYFLSTMLINLIHVGVGLQLYSLYLNQIDTTLHELAHLPLSSCIYVGCHVFIDYYNDTSDIVPITPSR